MSAIVMQDDETRQVARSLAVLVPLIKEDLEQAREASERAGMPYYRAAGEKMIEAKSQLKHGEFLPWIERNFHISRKQAAIYMGYAEHVKSNPQVTFESLNQFNRETGSSSYRTVTTKRDWHEPVQENIERARREAERIREETLSKAQERDAERQLALRLIDIGYKILVKELHPDKGGSRDVMQRLNRVRDRLKNHA